ncbi:glycosyltransferase family 2 protein [bacterium]|nr:glycosyltransferase family 2 protein [bacterium]
MPQFSIIIPTYNREDLLRETLESVIPNADPKVEIIVIDDGSTDESFAYLESLGSRVRVFKQSNQGPGAARNLGIENATGDYLVFLDSDDLFFPWTLDTIREVILATQAKLVFGKPYRFTESAANCQQESLSFLSFADYYASGDTWRWWGVSSFIIHRSLLQDVRFLTASINAEDADLVMQLGDAGKLAQITAPHTFAYREHDGSVMKNWDKNLAGVWNLVSNEKSQLFPGGRARQRERWRILGRHLRPVILESLRGGHRQEGVKLLRATLRWHLADRRFRFLAASLFHLIGFQR